MAEPPGRPENVGSQAGTRQQYQDCRNAAPNATEAGAAEVGCADAAPRQVGAMLFQKQRQIAYSNSFSRFLARALLWISALQFGYYSLYVKVIF